jgi:hypothetical protein
MELIGARPVTPSRRDRTWIENARTEVHLPAGRMPIPAIGARRASGDTSAPRSFWFCQRLSNENGGRLGAPAVRADEVRGGVKSPHSVILNQADFSPLWRFDAPPAPAAAACCWLAFRRLGAPARCERGRLPRAKVGPWDGESQSGLVRPRWARTPASNSCLNSRRFDPQSP